MKRRSFYQINLFQKSKKKGGNPAKINKIKFLKRIIVFFCLEMFWFFKNEISIFFAKFKRHKPNINKA